MLRENYPADIFTGESGVSGPGFVAKLRDALAVLGPIVPVGPRAERGPADA